MTEKDKRTYVKVHDGLPDHPKIIEAGGEAGWLYICGLAYASRQLTDGVISKRLVSRLTDGSKPEASASALVRVGLWHEGEHDCPKCPSLGPDVYVIHDYLDHQRSAAEVADLRAKRSTAGQRGGKRSGESRRAASEAEANSEASASANAKQPRSKNEPETETETETEEKRTTSSSSATAKPSQDAAEPIRHDIERTCRALAEAIEANGSKRPAITKAWRTAARLMIDKDGRTPDQILNAITWCQADEFWRANVLSMPTLRKQYDRLRLAATRQRQQASTALAPTGTTGAGFASQPLTGTDAKVAGWAAVAAQLAHQGDPQ